MAKTQITNEQIVQGYKNPKQKVIELNETRRQQKEADKELWDRIESRI